MIFRGFLKAKFIQNRSANDMQDGMLRSASIRSAKTPSDSLGCLQDDPKTPQRRPPGRPRRTQSASKTAPRRLQDGPRHPPDGPNCAQLLLRPPRSPPSLDFGPSGPRFWTLQTSILDPLYVDFRSSRPDKMQLCYFSFWRGGGDAALLRVLDITLRSLLP